jgi:hypothetical protein
LIVMYSTYTCQSTVSATMPNTKCRTLPVVPVPQYEPDNWWALEGMAEIIQPYDELPMIDQSVIDGAN